MLPQNVVIRQCCHRNKALSVHKNKQKSLYFGINMKLLAFNTIADDKTLIYFKIIRECDMGSPQKLRMHF